MNVKGVLQQLFESYPNAHATEGTVASYYRMLQNIPVDELQAVVDQCLVECTFLPTIAEIVKRHRLLTRDLSIPTAEQAWEEVRRSFGRVDRKPWSHPLIEEAVNVVGYRELGMSENQGNDMARFFKIYSNLVERQDQIARLTPAARQLAQRNGGLLPVAKTVARLVRLEDGGDA